MLVGTREKEECTKKREAYQSWSVCHTKFVCNFNVLEMDAEYVNSHKGDPKVVHSKHVLHTMNNLKGKSKVIDHMIQNFVGTTSQYVESSIGEGSTLKQHLMKTQHIEN